MQKKALKIKGHLTGIEQLDQEFLGLKDSCLYCLCCTEHVDHTNLLAKIIIGLASRDTSVVIFTFDCSHREMYNCMIEVIKKFNHSDSVQDSFPYFLEATQKYSSLAIWIEDVHKFSYNSLQNSLQRLCYVNKNAVECIVIDNIFKMDTDFKAPSTSLKIEANLYLMKMIAKENNIPVIIASKYDLAIMNSVLSSNYID